MGVNLSTVNLDGIDPNVAFDPLPAGWYNCTIINSEMKPSGPNAKDPDGMYLELTMQVMDGEHAGRKVFDRLNVQNTNAVATEIAFKTLKSIYNSVGKQRVDDSSELHGIPLKVKVKLRPKTAEYDANNEIQGYDHISSDHATGAGVGGAIAHGVPGAATGTPAWATGPGAAAPPVAPSGPPAAPAAPVPAVGGPAAVQQPWAQPAAAAAPPPPPPAVAPPPPPPAVQFPPDGWTAHPSAPGYFYMGQEVLSEADLRARSAPAPAVAAPPAMSAPAPATGAPGGPTPPWAR